MPLSVVAAKHLGAVESLVRLEAEYGGNAAVEIRVAVFQGVGQPFGIASVAKVREAMAWNIDQLVQMSYEILDGRYKAQQEGRCRGDFEITEAVYQKLRR